MKKIYEELLAGIPDYDVFFTADELDKRSMALAERYPDVVSISEIGKTKNGNPLYCLRIGEGKHVGLMFCCPHPNEPIGTMMLEYLTEQLAVNKELRDELDFTWYIVKAWDADGLRLNEKWLKGPYTIYNYSRNFFRPAGCKQVDWSFPVDYKEWHFHDPVPETEAMMKLIDEIRPEFIYSLHNAGLGAVYWYLTDGDQKLFDDLHSVPKKVGIPMNLGEPESMLTPELAPAIFELLTLRIEYDYIEENAPLDDMSKAITCGTSSADYAGQLCGAYTFLTELPYFYDKRVDDLRESDVMRRDAVLESMDWHEKANAELREIMGVSEKYLDPEDPFLLAVKDFTRDDSQEAMRKFVSESPEYARKATIAEEFDNALSSKFYKVLQYGMMVRANEDELRRMEESGEDNPDKKAALTKAFDMAVTAHKRLSDYLEENLDYEVVPINKLVRIQLECGLHVVEYLKERRNKE